MNHQRRNNNENANNNDNGGANVMNQLAETLATLVRNQQNRSRSLIAEFKRLSPPIFEGSTNHSEVDKWLQQMEKIFELLGSNDEQKVSLASYQLQGSAYDWWLMKKRRVDGNEEEAAQPYTWETFTESFKDKYFPRTIRAKLERDFIRLEQGEKQTVSEYEAKFARLAKYAQDLVVDEVSRARRFEEGLRSEIKRHVVVLNKALVVERGLTVEDEKKDYEPKKRAEPTSGFNENGQVKKFNNRGNFNRRDSGARLSCSRCGRNHLDKDCRWNTRACFSCGETGHKVAECPKRILQGTRTIRTRAL
ncbi:uncharacterized protein LOC108207573 [Daucus carota subsp. sativus]|uniref:uncharacterized protein LOC108207573 n=1 Tax=Daucus carota subsp. sativus TaxID=79200 RepID=UPI0007EF22FB|nr:PREDICTED: uncharacterized protein LOC108207573 [Daucus carota subsp. sativus]